MRQLVPGKCSHHGVENMACQFLESCTLSLAAIPSAPKGAIHIETQRGHKWPLFHGDLKERVFGNEIVEERLFRAAPRVAQNIRPLGPAAG